MKKDNIMSNSRNILRKELLGWEKWEIIWLIVATLVILGTSIYWQDSILSIVAGLTGIWCVILTGKGKLSSFLVGTVNSILYAILALKAKYLGEVMLNLIYYVPMNFVGMYIWSKNMNKEKEEVLKKRLTLKNSIIAYICVAFITVLYGFVLKLLKGTLPYIDSMSTIFSIFAQFLCVKRYMEQWVLWVIVDTVTVGMWIYAFINGTGDFATVMMWSVYLINAIIMLRKWGIDTKNSCLEEK